jgi:hypothetical protein
MRGLVPRIHALKSRPNLGVDGRDKPGHDVVERRALKLAAEDSNDGTF